MIILGGCLGSSLISRYSKWRSLVTSAIGCLVLSGCAALQPLTGFKQYAPNAAMLGQSPEQIETMLGRAAARLETGSGTRLIFTRGPFGRHSYAVDFDAQRKATGYQQLLVGDRFERIIPGMGPGEVIALIGPSMIHQGLARQWGSVWSYRYETTQCLWFQIEWDPQMKVRSAGYAIPPECQRRGMLF